MRKFFVVFWVALVVPCVAQGVVVLKKGEVTAQKLWVGAWANVTYRDEGGKQTSANGNIKEIHRNALTIGKGFWSERIAFDQIDVLVLGESARLVAPIKKALDADRPRQAPSNTSVVFGQLFMGGALGVGGGFVGAGAGALIAQSRDSSEWGYFPATIVLGSAAGVIVGSALGVKIAGDGKFYDSLWPRALLGSLVGFGLGVQATSMSEKLWPTMLIAPPLMATSASWILNERKGQYTSVNLGLSPSGQQGVTFAWHF